MYRPKMGIVKARKLNVRPKIILFSKTVQDYGNTPADICLVICWAGRALYLYAIANTSIDYPHSSAHPRFKPCHVFFVIQMYKKNKRILQLDYKTVKANKRV